MQIELNNVKYNKLKNITLQINYNSITGIVGTLGCGKTDLSLVIAKKVKPNSGELICDINENKIGIITNLSYDEMLYGTSEEFLKKYAIKYNYKISDIDKRIFEIIKMVGLSETILSKPVFNISKSEKTKLLISQILLYNPELIILDNIIEELDNKSRTKLFKLIIKLKKFYNKTILISSSNVNIIYELIDNLIILDNGNLVSYGNKYDVYKNIDNKFIDIPLILKFSKMIENNKNIKLGHNDNINELIKAIYREVR